LGIGQTGQHFLQPTGGAIGATPARLSASAIFSRWAGLMKLVDRVDIANTRPSKTLAHPNRMGLRCVNEV
jgi:hypothetical protein